MILTMAISFYASRVILQQLGVVDYGVYNIVGGLVTLFTFFNHTISVSVQRYMNYELGSTGGKNMQQVFATSCACMLILVALLILFAETIGLWFLQNKLSIPPERAGDALIVFQISLLTIIIEIMRVPYHALIIAHERMSFFAYNSIVEAGLKLALIISLSIIPFDKLITYAILMACVSLTINTSYYIYCRKKFSNLHFSVRGSKAKLKEIGKFTCWNSMEGISEVGCQQGSNIILNIFYGVTLNATMGVATQIKAAIFSFTRDIQVASNPQIVKSYAAGAYDEFRTLVMQMSRLSFFLMFTIGLPLYLNVDTVLNIWLKELPPYCIEFVKLVVILRVVDSLIGPLWISMQASGHIRVYQTVTSIILLMNLPICYIAFKLGCMPYTLILIQIIIECILIVIRLLFVHHRCNLSIVEYLRKVILPIVKVVVVSSIVPILVSNYLDGIFGMFISIFVSVISVLTSIYCLGITSDERNFVKTKVKERLNHK
jgi:O-antigen/teichoic acid export membrane protein